MPRTIPLLLSLAALALLLAPLSAHAASTARISITSDSQFAGIADSGDGTSGNPWIITDRAILASNGYGIEIKGTTAHVNITGVTVSSGGSGSDGIRLHNVRNVVVWGATLEGNRHGVHVLDSSDVTIAGSTIKTSRTGVLLENARSVTLRDNRIAVNERNVEFKMATGNVLQNNNLSTATGQFGLFFDKNFSYDNAIDTSNVVNSIPIQWHTNVAGTPGSPVVISGATMDLGGATNVAQIMIHNASHVRLERPVAKASATDAAGIHVYNSANVAIVEPTAEGNGGPGIFVEVSRDVAIGNGTARANVKQGVLVQSSPDVSIDVVNASANQDEGVKLSGSSRAAVRNSALHANLDGAILVNGSGSSYVAANVVSGAAAREITLDGATPYVLAANDVTATSGAGVSITRSAGNAVDNVVRAKGNAFAFSTTTGNNVTGSVVTLLQTGAIGFYFDQPASYDNNVTTTNLVNGTPVRWYNRASGSEAAPLVLASLSSEMKGITNVAQIMLYRSENVTLTAPAANNGTAAGIVSWESRNTRIVDARVSANAQEGILVNGDVGARIQSASISRSGSHGVKLANSTSATLENSIVENNTGRGVSVEGSHLGQVRGNAIRSNGGAGVFLLNAGFAGGIVVDNNLVRDNGGPGAHIEASLATSVRANDFASNTGDGVFLKSALAGVRVEDNLIAGHTRGVHFTQTGGAELHDNTINLTQPGSHGLFFDDEASYNATIPPTNVVNGTPVRWYVATTGTTGAPVIIPSIDANVTGLTNVAQVMIYRSQNVTLEHPNATNGTARGIYVLRSGNVAVQGGNVTGNAKAGVHVEASAGSRMDATYVARNAQGGVFFQESPRGNLTSLTVSENAQKGVAFDKSDGASIANSTIAGNVGVGVSISSAASAPSRVAGNAIRNNVVGLAVDAAWISDVAHNLVSENYPSGITLANLNRTHNVTGNAITLHNRALQITRSENGVYRENLMSISLNATGYHFGDELSYNNSIDTSNVVNGEAVRWYTNVVGPVTLTGMQAHTRGVTNVAQIMVYKSSNVTIQDARATSGVLHGIYVFRSNDTAINGSVASYNNGTGVSVYASARVSLRNSTMADDLVGGTYAELSEGFLVERATIERAGGNGVTIKTSNLSSVLNSSIRFSGQRGVSFVTSQFVNASFNDVRNSTKDGISVEAQSQGPRLFNNNLTGNGHAGVMVYATSQGARIEGNALASNARGIQLGNTTYAEVHENRITINGTQVGLAFDDEESYNNVIPRTNLVNGKPVQWFTTLTGTESNPIRLENVTAEVPNMTNVAQVMIFKSAYVNISGVVARDGVRGVYLYKSSSIDIEGIDATGSGVGVDLKLTQSSSIRAVTATGATVGVRLVESLSNVVTGVEARGASPGVSLDGKSWQNRVDRANVNGTSARGIIDASAPVNSLLGKNLVVDAGAGKRIKIGGTVNMTDNLASYRHDSERIVSQTWIWGDGTSNTSTQATLFRPSHRYDVAATFPVNYTVVTADGKTLSDLVFVHVIPPLSEPNELSAMTGDKNVTLRWLEPLSDAGNPVTKYRVFRSTDGANFTQVGGDLGNVRNYTDTGLVNGRQYYYRVAAVNAEGQGPNASVEAMPITLPSVPRALNATGQDGSVALAWQAPVDDGGVALRGYVVLRAANGSVFAEVATLGNVTTHVDAGLQNGVNYTYAVRAYTSVGNGTQSANASATPVGASAPPGAFTALPSDGAAMLAWIAPNATGGSPLTGYRVFRGSSAEILLPIADVPITQTSYRDVALSNGHTYHYAVAALNVYGAGLKAGPIEVVPDGNDTLRPVILELSPENDATLAHGFVTIVARYVDNGGVVPGDVELHIDGNPVALNGSASANELRWTTPEPLLRGFHSVRLILRDAAGNEAVRDWGFSVVPSGEDLSAFTVESFTLHATRVKLGQTIYANVTVRNTGLSAGAYNVSVQEGERVWAQQLVELGPGEVANLTLAFEATLAGLHEMSVDGHNASIRIEPLPTGAPTPKPTPPGGGRIKVPTVTIGALLALTGAAMVRRRR